MIQAYDIERLISKYFQELRMMPQQPAPYTPAQVPVDLTPVAMAITEGLTAIASALEYKAQLEDTRLREFNKQEEPKTSLGLFVDSGSPKK